MINDMISSTALDRLRIQYPKGARVQLIRMDDPKAPPVGTKGTVIGVDGIGSIMVKWDNGSNLNVLYREDYCSIIK